VVRQPHVLDRVQVAAAHALGHQIEGDLLDLDVPVTKVLLEEDLRLLRDYRVLVPAYVAEPELPVLRGATATHYESAHHEQESQERPFIKLPPLRNPLNLSLSANSPN